MDNVDKCCEYVDIIHNFHTIIDFLLRNYKKLFAKKAQIKIEFPFRKRYVIIRKALCRSLVNEELKKCLKI